MRVINNYLSPLPSKSTKSRSFTPRVNAIWISSSHSIKAPRAKGIEENSARNLPNCQVFSQPASRRWEKNAEEKKRWREAKRAHLSDCLCKCLILSKIHRSDVDGSVKGNELEGQTVGKLTRFRSGTFPKKKLRTNCNFKRHLFVRFVARNLQRNARIN